MPPAFLTQRKGGFRRAALRGSEGETKLEIKMLKDLKPTSAHAGVSDIHPTPKGEK
jgi:hypothetical protein